MVAMFVSQIRSRFFCRHATLLPTNKSQVAGSALRDDRKKAAKESSMLVYQ